MTDLGSTDHRDTPEQLPGLARDLAAIGRSGITTPAVRDESFRADVHRHFAGKGARRLRLPWLSAAAVLALLATAVIATRLLTTPTVVSESESTPALAQAEAGDVDGNGRVDILDALALARRLESGAALDAVHDLNGDGGVDRSDVDAIAGRAVALNGRTG